MNDNKEKWIEEVFQSMKGRQRAKPRPEVFTNIKEQIALSETKVARMFQWRYAAVAAVLVLALNIFTLRHYFQNNQLQDNEMLVSSKNYDQSLITNYKIYE